MVFFNNLPRMKDVAYVTNSDDKKNKGAHWVSLLVDRNTELYTCIVDESIICAFYCVASKEYRLEGKHC